MARENDEICQILGRALGYPWFKDDQMNFPGATEANGVCVGDHVAVTLAMEAARKITAAPKRAFEELTAKTYGELVSDALLEVKADPGSFVVGDAEYSALVDAAVLRRLQAFAAPVAPAWRQIDTAPHDGTVIDLYDTQLGRIPDCYWGVPHHSCGEAGKYCDDDWHRENDPGWVDSTFNERVGQNVTHWQPLPAAPGTQGGPDHG
jgi:hypothetical protein